jgi:PAS domain S-box-containing protein
VRTSFATYAASFAALGASLLIRLAADPWLGDMLPAALTFGAVAAAAWMGGYRPALLVAVVAFVSSAYLFIPPRGGLNLGDTAHMLAMVGYFSTAGVIIAFGEATRRAQARTRAQQEVFAITVRSIGDGVITTDVDGRVTYLNQVAESLTGWSDGDARGRPLAEVFRIVNESTRAPVENPATRALRDGTVVGLANHTILITRTGDERPIDDSAAPLRDDAGRVSGCVLIFRDVSQQRGVERERARQLLVARTLAAIVETSDDAIVAKGLDGIIRSWNAGAERMFGWTAEEAVGRHISLVIPPERTHEEDHIIASLAAGQRIEHFETERVRRDGERILVSLTISPLKDDAGNVVGASKIVRDVTVQRRTEERERRLLAAAAEANAKFRGLFEQGAMFAGIMDVDGTLREANQLSWEACGFTREQVIDKPFWEGPWWSPSAALVERIRQASAEAAAGRTFRAELPYFVGDGSERDVDLIIHPIRDDAGRVTFLAPTGIDITDRKRAEADRERFATLVETSTDFIGICDLNGMPLYVNRAGLELVGLDDLAHARRTPVAEFFFPEDRARVQTLFPAVLANGHGAMEVRFRNFKTGEARWMAYKVIRLADASGRPTGSATVSQDVTERKRMTDDLERLNADLAEADRRKDEFLATLAHELRNPLAPIGNMLEVLKHADGDRDLLARARDTMERQLAQMVRLVDDLLDLNRITHNRLELRTGPVDLATVVRDAVEASRPLVDAAKHELHITLPDEPLPLHADAARLAQVFANLLSNACRYTPANGTIDITARRDAGDVVVSVRDDGIGIPPDKLDSIFDMFTQVDRSTEQAQAGLGIGLTLVKQLVEMHGGSVTVRSEGRGRGSEFVVRLPVAREPTTAPPPSAATAAPARRRRILIVDDNVDAAVSLAMLLEINGNEVHTAHDGIEAVAAVSQRRPDVVLLDIGLPKLDGHEVCRRVRAEPWGRDVAIVALTGWGQEDDRRRSEDAGFDGHLVKPVDHGELARLLDRLTP